MIGIALTSGDWLSAKDMCLERNQQSDVCISAIGWMPSDVLWDKLAVHHACEMPMHPVKDHCQN